MKASLVIDYHLDNKIFNLNDKAVNRDDYAYSIWLLKSKFFSEGIDLSTYDINFPEDSMASLYFDYPRNYMEVNSETSYLVLFESEVIEPKSWNRDFHKKFKKIFTWNDDIVDDFKYFKINFSHKFPEDIAEYRRAIKTFEEKKLCTLIAGNKRVSHELELYSERVKTIRWFEKYTSEGVFELYGVGWGDVITRNRYLNFIVKKMGILKPFFYKYKTYKGVVDNKKITLSGYKFAICYENAQMIPGYITEKIFDCFFAGCVPIYWGAPNVTEYIPEGCFIDRRKFNSHEELYSYLTAMTEEQYLDIQKNIECYIFSEKADPFRAEVFADTLVGHILDEK